MASLLQGGEHGQGNPPLALLCAGAEHLGRTRWKVSGANVAPNFAQQLREAAAGFLFLTGVAILPMLAAVFKSQRIMANSAVKSAPVPNGDNVMLS